MPLFIPIVILTTCEKTLLMILIHVPKTLVAYDGENHIHSELEYICLTIFAISNSIDIDIDINININNLAPNVWHFIL
jgi:hypothetical protein